MNHPGDNAPRILVADQLAEDGLAKLRQAGTVEVATGLSEGELVSRIGGFSALVVRSETKVTRPVIEAA
ncbi:MAG: phosphoglycerate dehydrogenase, partial [Candidatus Dormibacteria bacterium]